MMEPLISTFSVMVTGMPFVVLSTTKYPYGLTPNGRNRGVTETYVYDRLGRISRINVRNGYSSVAEMARYYYFPTGAVRGIILGNSISMYYMYHISGAVKRVEIKDVGGGGSVLRNS